MFTLYSHRVIEETRENAVSLDIVICNCYCLPYWYHKVGELKLVVVCNFPTYLIERVWFDLILNSCDILIRYEKVYCRIVWKYTTKNKKFLFICTIETSVYFQYPKFFF